MADQDKPTSGAETGARQGADSSNPVDQHTLDSGSTAALPGAENANTRRNEVNTGDAVVDHTVASGSTAAVPDPDAAAAATKTGSGAESGVSNDPNDRPASDDRSLGGDADLLDNPSETREARTERQGERGDIGDVGEEGAV